MPHIHNVALILSQEERERLPTLARRLGCDEEAVPQRLMDLAMNQLEELSAADGLEASPGDGGDLPLVRDQGLLAPAQPDFQPPPAKTQWYLDPLTSPGDLRPSGVNRHTPGIDASGRHPDVPEAQYRRVEGMTHYSEKARSTLRKIVSRNYLLAQREYEATGGLKLHAKRKALPTRVVWSLWGPLKDVEQEITWDHVEATVNLVAGLTGRARAYRQRHPRRK